MLGNHRKLLSILVLFAMMFTMIIPVTVFAEDIPVIVPGEGEGDDGSEGKEGESAVTINIKTLEGVTVPVTGETPVTEITETDEYTGEVTWEPADDVFAAETEYTATISLTPKEGFTLTGVTANFFTVDGATETTNDEDSGAITAVFPATEAEPKAKDGLKEKPMSYVLRTGPATLEVGEGESIQDAINAASAGDTIEVSAGVYVEDVVVNNKVTIIGVDGADKTKIVATNGNSCPLTFNANDATVRGFTLTHKYTGTELEYWNFNNNGVTFVQGTTENTLEDCVVTLNRNGIYLNNCQGNTITNNTIYNNRTGINMTNNVNGTVITGNKISENWTLGLVFYSLGSDTDFTSVTVFENTFDNNWYSEILIKDAGGSSGTLNVTNNTFTDNTVTYTDLADGSLNEPGFDTQKPNVDGIGGDATKPEDELPTLRIYKSGDAKLQYDNKTLFVGNHEGQYTTYTAIQSAIDAASAGDTIIVAAGLYNEVISITKPLTLLGATHGVDKREYNVNSAGTWNQSGESVIQHPDSNPSGDCVVDINGTSDVTFDGFVVQVLNANGNALSSLVRVTTRKATSSIANIQVINNIIGPFTKVGEQDGTHGRMGLYIVNDPYNSALSVKNSTFAYNKIFGAEGNGNNVFVWSAYHSYGAAVPSPMDGTVIEYNDIFGSHRSGIETAGGFMGLVIRDNTIHDNGCGDTSNNLKYGNGIVMLRGTGDNEDDLAYGPKNLTIQNNEIYGNAKHGIYSGPVIDGLIVEDNNISNNGLNGVIVDLDGKYHGDTYGLYNRASNVKVNNNTIEGNGSNGVKVQGTPTNDFVIDAEKNYWGEASGPTHESNPEGSGDAVVGVVTFDPWYTSLAKDTLASNKSVYNQTKMEFYSTIKDAIDDADSGDIISLAAGTYTEGKIIIDKDLTVIGEDKNTTIIQPAEDIIGKYHEDGSAWFVVNPKVTFNLSNVTLDGIGNVDGGKNIKIAIISHGSGVIENNIIKNIYGNHNYHGLAIELHGSDMTVRGNSFSNIQRIGVYTGYGNGAIIENNTYKGKGEGDHLDYAFEVGRGGQAIIRGNTISGNQGVASTDGSTSAGILVTSLYGSGTAEATISGNTITDCRYAVYAGYNETDESLVTVTENNLAGNLNGVIARNLEVNATKNWWGTAKKAEIQDLVIGNVDYNPWYVNAAKTRLINNGYNLTTTSKSETSVVLSWNGVDGVDGYNVYRGNEKLNDTLLTATTYTASGLSAETTYSFNLKVVIDGKEHSINDSVLSVTTDSYSSSEDDSSSSGGTIPPAGTPAPAALEDPVTEDDKKLNDSLTNTGEAKLNLAGDSDGKANLSTNIVTQLAQENQPLTVESTGVGLTFAPTSLVTPELTEALDKEGATVEIGARQVTETEKEEIIAGAALGQSTGVFEVGGVIVDLSAQVTSDDGSTKIEGFAEPVAVTIDLSGLDLTPEQISELSGVRFEKDEDGNVVPVPLGGSYDPETKTFTFYTTKFSLYSVLQVKDLVTVELAIGNSNSKVNGKDKSVDVPPTIINNRTMVPLRFIGEALGAEFDWDAKTRTVTVVLGEKELKLVIDKLTPGLDVPATIVNGRTLVPVRYVSENFGANVTWFPTERKVSIVKK